MIPAWKKSNEFKKRTIQQQPNNIMSSPQDKSQA